MRAFNLVLLVFLIQSCNDKVNIYTNQIDGDFNGDGNLENASLNKVSAKSIDFENFYEIEFSDKSIKKINISTNSEVLGIINEDDLNNDSSDELSIIFKDEILIDNQQKYVVTMHTRKFNKGKWSYVIEPITISLNSEDFEKKIDDFITKKGSEISVSAYNEIFFDSLGNSKKVPLLEKIVKPL